MVRTILALVTLLSLSSACSLESPDAVPPANTAANRGSPASVAVQYAQRPEITVDKVLADIVGKEVIVRDAAGKSEPLSWLFEASEPKRAEIVERKGNEKGASLVIQLDTSGAPGSDDANIQLAGRLMLHYEWTGEDWALRRIQNMTFRYTRRMMI